MSPVVVLVGAPGSGKSTVGRLVAERLGTTFRDTDADIEAAVGRSIPDIFVQDGEAAFRAAERLAVAAGLEEHDGVLALGGGAVVSEPTRALLARHTVCWLRVGLAECVARVGLSGGRPLLLGNVRGRLMTMLDERAPLYAEVADIEVDTDGRGPDAVADDVLTELGRLGSAHG